MTGATCHVSRVTCHVSRVTCHMSQLVDLVVGGSVINGAYPPVFQIFGVAFVNLQSSINELDEVALLVYAPPIGQPSP